MGGEMRRWRSHHRSDYCDQGGLSVLGTLPVTSRALRCIGQEGVKKVGNTCKRVEKKLVRKKARCSTLGVVCQSACKFGSDSLLMQFEGFLAL
jgi:hypothetical protein